jgi:hypothetical protein
MVMRISTVVAMAAAFAGAGVAFVASAQTLGSDFTYQGTFADGGAPANGSYDFQFLLFSVSTGGTAVQTVTKSGLAVNGGLINASIDFGPQTYNGQVKWIEVHVRPSGGGAYTTLSPRQALTAAPYAMGLPMPFQRAVNTGSTVAFQITNADGGSAIAGVVPGTSGFSAVLGTSGGGPGVNGDSTTNAGVRGTSVQSDGVRGLSTSGYGVHGVGTTGVWAEGGLLATDNISCNTGGGFCASVMNVRNGTIGNLIIGTAGTPAVDVFRVNGNGSVFANGDYNAGGADVAEYVPATETLQPGDVVEIDEDNGAALRLSSQSNSTSVAGVISTRPGLSLNTSTAELEAAQGMPRLALSGRVPVKVSSENGAIRAGDLLVSGSKPGRAMRAPKTPLPGTVIGKAMQKMDSDVGQIEMLVMLR